MKVLVTGATGFVGGAVIRRLLAEHDVSVRAATRTPVAHGPPCESVVVGEISSETNWTQALEGVDVVVHLAARVHVMHDRSDDPLAAFRAVNVAGTMRLARLAAANGVRRFLFVSSIKVNGEETRPDRPYHPDDPPAPVDAYGISKAEAESALRALSDETRMEVTIIRPVLVYGPGVKGNFLALLRVVRRGLPLPFGAVWNKRSLVAVDNLADLIARAIRHPAAANETFLASDGHDLSTTELVRRLARALDRPARLLPISAVMLSAAATIVGRRAVARRVLGTLQVDIGKTRRLLDWSPPVDVDTALAATARHFVETTRQTDGASA